MKRLCAFTLLLSCLSCNYDTGLPDPPVEGTVSGTLNTAPVPAEGHDVTLVDTEGERRTVQTREGGAFTWFNVKPGLYAIDTRLPGFAPLVVPNIRVRSGEAVDLGTLQPVYLSFADPVPTGFLSLEGVLGDGSASETLTAQAGITAVVTQQGAAYFALADGLAACPPALPLDGWAALPDDGRVTVTLAAGGTRTVGLCLRNVAGLIAGPVSRTITFDGQAPQNCALTAQGRRADNDEAAPAGRTAKATIDINAQGCAEAPVDWVVSEDELTCTAPGLPWAPFAPGSFTLRAGEGAHVLRACVRGASRVAAALDSVTMDLDTTPPQGVSILLDEGALWLNAAQKAALGGVNRVTVRGFATGGWRWALSEGGAPSTFLGFVNGGTRTFNLSANDGRKTVTAWFTDELGNLATAQATITVDTAAPDVQSLTLDAYGPSANEYTNSLVLTVALQNLPGDAVAVQLAQAQDSDGNGDDDDACAESDFTNAATQAAVSNYIFILRAEGEGRKRVCARFFDAAGNPSTLDEPQTYADTVTLDLTPPSQPLFLTQDQYLSAHHGAPFTVQLFGPVDEPAESFARYERIGGLDSVWTPVGTSLNLPEVEFLLSNPDDPNTPENEGPEFGVTNALRLRAVDLAGNFSGESVVFVTADDNPPDPPDFTEEYIDHRATQASVFWGPSYGASGYELEYVEFGGEIFNGFSLPEGPSPIDVGEQLHITLSGLNNQSELKVRPVAYDLAGNRAWGLTIDLRSSLGGLSPNIVGTLPFDEGTDTQHIGALAVAGHHLYALGSNGECESWLRASGTPCDTTLRVYDVADVQSPVSFGAVNPDAGRMTRASDYLVFTGDDPVKGNHKPMQGLLADGQRLFVASGKVLRIFDLSNPAVPGALATIDFSAIDPAFRVDTPVALYGSKLVVTGRRANLSGSPTTGDTLMAVVNLAALHDENAATRPSHADVEYALVTNAGGQRPLPTYSSEVDGQLFFINTHTGWKAPVAWALDDTPATAFSPAAVLTYGINSVPFSQAGVQRSGNLLVTGASHGMGILPNLLMLDLNNALDGGAALPVAGGLNHLNLSGFDVAGQLLLATGVGSDGYTSAFDLAGLPAAPPHFQPPQVAPTPPAWFGEFGGSGQLITAWGNYAFHVETGIFSNASQLRAYELATPRALRVAMPTGTGAPPGAQSGGPLRVSGGLAALPHGMAYDLLARSAEGPLPVLRGPGQGTDFSDVSGLEPRCEVTTAFFPHDITIGAHGNRLQVTRGGLAARRVGPGWTGFATELPWDGERVSLPAGHRVIGLAGHGTALVTAQVRTGTADDGVWLQVFDARNALDGRPATAFVPGAGLMAMRLGTTDDLSVTRGHVTVADGRAVVTFADDMVTHVHFVDLRALFDDDAATTFVPATAHQGSYIEEATFGLNNFYREGVMTVMQGHHAWTGATRTVVGVDAAKAFDDDPGTKVDQPDSCGIPGISCISPRIQVGVPSQPIFPESLRVYGTRLYSAGSSRMSVWDISTPSQPRIVATHAFADTFGTGCMVEGHSVGWSLPAGIDVAGSRVFINKADGLNVLELE